MGGRGFASLTLTLAVLAAACSEKATDAPTSPNFAPPVQNGCNTTELSNLIKAEFGNASDEAKLATDLKNYGAKTSQATYVGYQLLDAIAAKYEIPANQVGSRLNASNAAIAIFGCINVGAATIPTSFEDQLGLHGAFAVRGFDPSDNQSVFSHDGVWVLEPPALQTWAAITTLATTDLADSVDNLFLAHGNLVEDTEGFTGQGDDLVGSVFDWNTIPTATFGSVSTSAVTTQATSADLGVIVGECPSTSNYIQHNSASEQGLVPDVGGFVPPSCYEVIGALREREPRSFAERLIRFFSPTPAFAALLESTGTGTGKRTLSQYGLVDPNAVNLDQLFTWKTKAAYTVGVPFAATLGTVPKYQIESQAGTIFTQDFVLLWVDGTTNNGAKKAICNNFAFTNANGVAQFPLAFPNGAGGVIVTAHTTGTSSKPGVEEGPAPTVPAGASVPSPGINVKNGTVASDCLIFSPGDPLPEPPGPNGFAP